MPDQQHDEGVVRHGDLDIEENMDAQRLLWKVQRIVRAAALLILALALTGAFGGGPLSRDRVADGRFSIGYDRIGYRDTPQTLRVSVVEPRSGSLRLWIDRETLGRLRLSQVVPAPVRTVLGADRLVFEFEAGSEGGTAEVLFEFEPKGPGSHTARIGVVDGPSFRLKQLFLP